MFFLKFLWRNVKRIIILTAAAAVMLTAGAQADDKEQLALQERVAQEPYLSQEQQNFWRKLSHIGPKTV
jgi:hypothetical protein